MQALWLQDRRLQVRDDVPRPLPTSEEAVIRVLRAGICNTDLELVRGYYPYQGVLGHEFVGVVEKGPSSLIGQRVVGEINAVCRECPACRSGRSNHCEQRTVLGIVGRHGAFAEYLKLPVANLHLVPDAISLDEATFVEPLAAALQIQEQVTIRPTDRVLLVGDGKLGQLIARTVASCGCALTVVGRHPHKLMLLRERGITAIQGGQVRAGAFDVAIECTGNSEGFQLALSGLRPCGTLVMKSTYKGLLSFDASAMVVDEITLVGSRCGPFEPALRLLAERDLGIGGLIEARYPLDAALGAFEHAQRPGAMKVLLEIASF